MCLKATTNWLHTNTHIVAFFLLWFWYLGIACVCACVWILDPGTGARRSCKFWQPREKKRWCSGEQSRAAHIKLAPFDLCVRVLNFWLLWFLYYCCLWWSSSLILTMFLFMLICINLFDGNVLFSLCILYYYYCYDFHSLYYYRLLS